jgi:hypothetical protein
VAGLAIDVGQATGEVERVGNLSRDWARVLLDVEVARELRARVEEAIEQAGIPLPSPTEALVIGPER